MNINTEEYLKARVSAFKFITFKRRTIKETENKLKSLEIKPEYIDAIIEELVELEYLNDEIYVEKFDTNNKYTYVTVITEDKQQLSGYVETKYIKLIEDNPNITSAYILLAISILIATASVIIYVKQKSSN
jgi:SOS response regulatory protein OraA/RecX